MIDDIQNMEQIEQLEEIQQAEKNNLNEFDWDQIQSLEKNSRKLFLKINSAQRFDQFQEVAKSERRKIQLFVSFLSQRQSSKYVNLEVEPQLQDQVFVFSIVDNMFDSPHDLNILRRLNQQVEIILALVNPKTQQRDILSIKKIEWRFALTYAKSTLSVEFTHLKDEKSVVGVIQITMELVPHLTEKQMLSEQLLLQQLKKEQEFRTKDQQDVYKYAQKWWDGYRSAYGKFEKRLVKIYAENEEGKYVPICSFVSPLLSIQGIDSPNHAARFVSLIPFQRSEKSQGVKSQIWSTFHSFISRRAGDVEDHCSLLCSLLLGFGLDAYICYGTNASGIHAWVLTI